MTSLVSASVVTTGQIQTLDSVRAHALPSDALIFASGTKVQPANQNPGAFSLVESANALTLTTTGSVPVVTQSPFADLYKEGSLYFGGVAGNYVSATATGLSGTQWNTTGMTIEAWVNYPTFVGAGLVASGTITFPYLLGSYVATSATAYWGFGANTLGYVTFAYYSAGANGINASVPLSTNTWNHIAFSCVPGGATANIYVNGVSVASTSISGTPTVVSSTPLTLGQLNNGAVTAYVADIRITTGAALYTGSSFTVPAAPLSPAATGVAQALIRAGQNSPTTQNGALTFDRGLKQYMEMGPMTWNWATRGFTAVFKYTWNGVAAPYDRILSLTTTNISGSMYGLVITRANLTNALGIYYYTGGGPTLNLLNTTTIINTGTTYVITFVYNPSIASGTGTFWVNGVPNATATGLSSTITADLLCPYGRIGANQIGTEATSASMNTFAVYNRPLSNVEIYNSYLALSAAPQQALNTTVEFGDVNGTPALSIAGDGRVAMTNIGQTSNVLPWPPAAMTGYDTVINGGVYKARASSEFSGTLAWYAFDKANGTPWASLNGTYSTTTPFGYLGSVTTTDTQGTVYPGEWIQIQLPNQILLSSYYFQVNAASQFPAKFVMLGSRDGTNWTLVDSRTYLGATSATFTLSTVPSQSFSYFRTVVNQISATSGAQLAAVAEWILYGTADTAQTLTVAQPMTLSYGAQTASLTGISGDKYVPQDFSSSGLNIPAYVVSNTATVANTVSYSSFGPFAGEGSVYFPGGTGAYVNFPSSAVTLWPGGATSLTDGTVEAWVYLTQYNSTYSILFVRTPSVAASQPDWYFAVNSSGNLVMYFVNTGLTTYSATGGIVPLNTWTHVAGSVKSSVISVFVNGAATTGQTFSGTMIGSAADPLLISAFNASAVQTIKGGYVASARIVSGQALYTSAFTPPTGPLQPIQGTTQAGLPYGTVLLLRNAPAPGRILTQKFGGANSVGVNGAPLTVPFPPAAMTSYATTLNTGYGQGTYVASASSELDATGTYASWRAFDKVTGSGYWFTSSAVYSTNAPYGYTGTVTTVDVNGNSYAGEWIQVQNPSSIVLSSYSILQVAALVNYNSPSRFWLLGSRDGINWSLVDSRTGATWVAGAYSTFTTAASQAFTHFRLVINQVTGYNISFTVGCGITEWTLNGTIEGPNVSADGRLGVGVSNPVQALEVAGTAVVAGTVSAGNPLMFRNRIINGDMRINQRGTTSFSGLSTTAYCFDRFLTYIAGTGGGTRTINQVTDVPFGGPFFYSANVIYTAQTTGVVETFLRQGIELFNCTDLTKTPITVSFWYKSNRIGTHGARLVSNSLAISNMSDSAQGFNVNNGNTWEYKVLTFGNSANSSLITSASLNQLGINLDIGPMVAGQSSITINNNDYFTLTGVQLEKGTVATPFEFRPYATELALCQRYYELVSFAAASGATTTGTTLALILPYTVQKRNTSSQSIALVANLIVTRPNVLNYTITPANASISAQSYSLSGASFVLTDSTQTFNFTGQVFGWISANSPFAISCEL